MSRKLFFTAISLLAVLFGFLFFNIYEASVGDERPSVTLRSSSRFRHRAATRPVVTNQVATVSEPEKKAELASGIPVVFTVGATTYPVLAPENSSIYEAMGHLAATTDFNFVAKKFPSLGYFVEQINGVKNADGAYWTLYINGVYSTVGASQYQLKAGDRVEWRYERK